MKLTDIRGMWKKNKYWEENLQTDTVTVNFAPVKSVQKDSAMEVDELTAFFFFVSTGFLKFVSVNRKFAWIAKELTSIGFF